MAAEVKSHWEHSGCLFANMLSLLTHKKKQLSLQTPLQFQSGAQTHEGPLRRMLYSPGCFIPVIYALYFSTDLHWLYIVPRYTTVSSS